jgi:hypothetical protein
MLTRREARRRLIARWHSAVAELPAGREPLFGLQRFVTEENIQVVQSLGLYASHSDERRDRELIAAGCRRDVGGLRNRVFARTGRRTHRSGRPKSACRNLPARSGGIEGHGGDHGLVNSGCHFPM